MLYPVSPVLPSAKISLEEVVIAKDQPQYRPLPAVILVNENGHLTVVTCWKMSFLDRIKVLLGGRLWLQQLSFGKPLQPQLPTVDEPIVVEGNEDFLGVV